MSRKNLISFFIVIVAWAAVILFHIFQPPSKPIAWDVFGYYLYLPLTFIYHDLGIQHKEIIDHIFELYNPSSTFYQATHIPGGNWMMKYSMGMAILYSPGFFVANILAPVLGYPTDGFSTPYQVGIVVNSILFFMVGFWYFRKVLLHFFSDGITAMVLVLIYFGTNYYSYANWSSEMSHNYLFTFYALIIWNTIQWHKHFKMKNMVALALLIGLATLARPTELISALIPFLWGVDSKKTFIERIHVLKTTYRKQIVVFIIIMAAIGSLQIIYWKIYSGNFIYYSYVNPGEGFEFLSPYIFKVLFSFRKGWFIYTPVMMFAVAGFWVLYKYNKKIFYSLFIFFALNLYIVSSWSCWWYAQSMSQRALVQSYAVMGIPLGYFIRWVMGKQKIWKGLFLLVALFFVGLNVFQNWQMRKGIMSGDRMTFKYYLKTFGKTKISPEDKKLLLVNRMFRDNVERIEDKSALTSARLLRTFSFENTSEPKGKHYTTEFAHSGKHSIKMDSTLHFSPSFDIPFAELTNHYYAWIKASVWVYPVSNPKETPASLVVTFQHKGKNYKYKTKSIENEDVRKSLKLNQWNKIEILYLTPEVRNKNDKLVVYVWNRGKNPVYFDDMKIEIMEPKDE